MIIVSAKRVAEDHTTVMLTDDQGIVYYCNEENQLVLDFVAGGGVIQDADPIVVPPYTIGADLPWLRMTDEEAELVQAGIDASPIKTRNVVNKATSFTEGTDAFNMFLTIITAALSAERAAVIMGPMTEEEAASA